MKIKKCLSLVVYFKEILSYIEILSIKEIPSLIETTK